MPCKSVSPPRRGTRLDPDSGKLMFRVFDYTEATRLLGLDFLTKFKGSKARPSITPPPAEPPAIVDGVQIRIEPTGRYLTATVDGRHARITLEQYREHIAGRLRVQFEQLQQLKAALTIQLEALDKLPGAYLREAFGGLQ